MSSIRGLISWASQLLEENGIASPRSEAEQILMHLLKTRRMDLYLSNHLTDRLDESAFRQLAQERTKGIPLQYLLGVSYFWCWEFLVRPGVFIPRAETEILIDWAIHCFKNRGNGNSHRTHLLDLGTGSGNIAITLTKVLPNCKISAIEISPTAIEVAKENTFLHGVEERIDFFKRDWRGFLGAEGPATLGRVDGVIANPPYIPSQEIEKLDLEVRLEPREALDGGPEGLDWIGQILREGRNVLADHGFLILEIGDSQAECVRALAQENGWNPFGFVRDLRGIERVFWALKEK